MFLNSCGSNTRDGFADSELRVFVSNYSYIVAEQTHADTQKGKQIGWIFIGCKNKWSKITKWTSLNGWQDGWASHSAKNNKRPKHSLVGHCSTIAKVLGSNHNRVMCMCFSQSSEYTVHRCNGKIIFFLNIFIPDAKLNIRSKHTLK